MFIIVYQGLLLSLVFYSLYVTHLRHKPTLASGSQIDKQSDGVFEQSSKNRTTVRSMTEVDCGTKP